MPTLNLTFSTLHAQINTSPFIKRDIAATD